MKDAITIAREMREEAVKMLAAAEILDPPKRRKPGPKPGRKPTNGRRRKTAPATT